LSNWVIDGSIGPISHAINYPIAQFLDYQILK